MNSNISCEGNTTATHMRKLRLREAKPLAQVHSARGRQSQGSNPAPLDSTATGSLEH